MAPRTGSAATAGPAAAISTDIVAKLSDAIENLEAIPSDEMLVLLNEALDVIRELVQLADGTAAD
jgi:hypothetical protein